MNYRYIAGLAAFGALFHVASAADGFFESETIFSIGFGGDAVNSMSAAIVPGGGPYENFAARATGDGFNYGKSTSSFWDGSSSGYVFAQGGSHSDAFGSADEFQGMNFFIDITNNSTFATGSFTVSELLERALSAAGPFSQATAYGGVQEYIGNNPIGYATDTLNWDGTYTRNSSGNFADDGNSAPPNYFEETGSLSDTLTAGQTVELQIWASGETHVLTPEPMTMGLGLGVLGLLARRRRKQA